MKDKVLEQKKATETLNLRKHDPSQPRMIDWIDKESSWGTNYGLF